MDRYAREERFLMNIGPDKGALVQEVFDRIPSDARILEVGAYCGYSAVLFASMLGAGGLARLSRGRGGERRGRAGERRVRGTRRSSRDRARPFGRFDSESLWHRSIWSSSTIGRISTRQDLQAIEAKRAPEVPGVSSSRTTSGESFNPDRVSRIRPDLRALRVASTAKSTIEYHTLPDAVEISVYRGPGEA